VSIYLIHSITKPFCCRSGCWCHAKQAQIAQLLAALKRNDLQLTEPLALQGGKRSQGNERKA
jgi:hypothetical protein